MTLSRRHFLRSASAAAIGFAGLQRLAGCKTPVRDDYGALVPDPEGLFDLPEGFSYKVISRYGQRMDDGLLVPHRPDGMAAFPGPDGLTILVRNHEVHGRTAGPEEGAFGEDLAGLALIGDKIFDPGNEGQTPALGGTTTVVYDTRTGETVRQFMSLAGTIRNCAGGPTPWNSWLSCEEDMMPANQRYRESHGWVFEVPATAHIQLADPEPIRAMGRFYREGVAVDPETGIVYMTEDLYDGLLYRYIPNVPGALAEGGRVQAMAFSKGPQIEVRNQGTQAFAPGHSEAVHWVDMDELDNPNDDLRKRGRAKGAAYLARAEGIAYGDGRVFIACTEGGLNREGQILRYTPSPFEGTDAEADAPATLQLYAEPNDTNILENCDNLCMAPWGDVVIAEDASTHPRLSVVTSDGVIRLLGRNAKSNSELAGPTFSPDGTTLFVNIQHEGVTLAITGPWV
ncbi:MAG: secreted PhoX family phosphatase [Rhodothermales bacterium]